MRYSGAFRGLISQDGLQDDYGMELLVFGLLFSLKMLLFRPLPVQEFLAVVNFLLSDPFISSLPYEAGFTPIPANLYCIEASCPKP